MPTKIVCEAYDKVRRDALAYFALKKALAAKVQEIQASAEKVQLLTGISSSIYMFLNSRDDFNMILHQNMSHRLCIRDR
jgi:hypothetical protein